MKNSFNWMFAAILICGLAVSSCKKDPEPTPEPEPTTQTVLGGMVGTGVYFYDSVTYSYEYDAEYRLVRSEAHVTNGSHIIHDLYFTYSDGSIMVTGTSNESPITIECTLDNEGRITHYVRTLVHNDTVTDITTADFTYDADGYLATEHTISDPNTSGVISNYVWDGGELKMYSSSDETIKNEFEISDAPAQVMFDRFGYDIMLSELCSQGCFGKLPAHMPSKSTFTTSLQVPGLPDIVKVTDYTYTIDADGRLATMEEISTGVAPGAANYTFNWEER